MPHRKHWYDRYAETLAELMAYAHTHRHSRFPEDPVVLEIIEKHGLSKEGIDLVKKFHPGDLYFKRYHGVSPRLTRNLARIFAEEGMRRGDHKGH